MMSRICRPYECLFLSLMFIVTLQQNSLPACIACINVTVSHSYVEDVLRGEDFVWFLISFSLSSTLSKQSGCLVDIGRESRDLCMKFGSIRDDFEPVRWPILHARAADCPIGTIQRAAPDLE